MSDSTRDGGSSANWKVSLLVGVVILAVAGGLAVLIFSTEPTAQRQGATKKTAMLVEVVEVERQNHQPRIAATGTVEPSKDVILSPQVDGRIVELSPAFVPGGFVEKGDVLVRLESADYRNTLTQRKSELQDAVAALAIEAGRRDAAKAEYDYLNEKLESENEALVLRKPQLEAARQRVEAARAAVAQAELNVRRTTVRAPFDAHILSRDVNVGSQVNSNTRLGRLVGMDTYWIGVEVPLSKLRWLTPAEDPSEASEVRVRNRTAWPEDTYRAGHIYKMVGALDPGTRMARVLAAVPDPLARGEASGKPKLIIGEFVEVTIHGNQLENVVRIERDYLRDGETVWTMVDGKLKVNDVEVLLQDAEYAYIKSGLGDAAKIVTTNISTVVDGAPLRTEGDEMADAEAAEEASDE